MSRGLLGKIYVPFAVVVVSWVLLKLKLGVTQQVGVSRLLLGLTMFLCVVSLVSWARGQTCTFVQGNTMAHLSWCEPLTALCIRLCALLHLFRTRKRVQQILPLSVSWSVCMMLLKAKCPLQVLSAWL